MFDPWNLVTIGIVVVALAAYRILDRDNRSLEKVKKYADRLKDELSAHAEARREDLKAYAIDLDVHQKAAREVLKRVQSVEVALNERADAIGTIASRIAEYDKALAELKDMSGRVDQNLRIIHEESDFVDSVAKTLKASKQEIQELKASVPGIREGIASDAKAMLTELHNAYSVEIKSSLDDSLNTVESLRLKAEQSADSVGAMHAAAAQAAEDRYKTIASQLQDAFKRARDEGEKLEDASFQKLRDQIEARGSKLSEALESRFDTIRDQAKEKVAETQALIKHLKSEWKKDAEAILLDAEASAKASAEAIEQRLMATELLVSKAEAVYTDRFAQVEIKAQDAAKTLHARFTEVIKTHQEDLTKRQAELRTALKDGIAEMGASAMEAQASQAARLASMESALSSAEQRMGDRVHELEQRALSGFEQRADELRAVVEQGLDRLEAMRMDADRMEKALRDAMGGVERRVGEDFALFGKDLAARQAAFEEEFRGESARVKSSVQDLENDLNALKSRAYANVSEKLKVFEDEFFADLRKRREDADERFSAWRVEMDEKLAQSQREAVETRSESEKAWTDEQRAALAQTQSRVQEQMDKLAAQVEAHRDAISERVSEADGALASLKAAVKADLDDARAAADAFLNAELERWKHDGGERLRMAERAASEDAKALEAASGKARERFESAAAAVLADAAKWKEHFTAAHAKAHNEQAAAIQALGLSFKTESAAISSDWDKEKKRILETAKTEREAIARDVRSLGDEVSRFRQEFAQKTAQALDDLGRSYDGLSSDAARKVADAQAAMAASLEEYRRDAKTIRDNLDSTRQLMSAGLSEEKKTRETLFTDMDKQIKAFQNQTKLFDRADELKASLGESIEAMKADMARAESRRAEMAELETQYGRVKRLEDELSQKIARFFAEKRRIDTLEDDFKRLLAMSQGVDQKLASLTESSDQLSQIQAEMRRLTDAADEAAEKYERVERKSNILDATADAVDKNFQAISELERSVRGIDTDVRQIPDQVIDLKRSLEEVLSAKPALDAAVLRLDEMSKAMTEAERRAGELNKAREWLARAETRFEELNKKTQDHLKLLNDLLKDEPDGKRKDKGAPSLSVQETVRKLSHQGWKVEEIARAVKLSRGEVELILELGHQE